MPFWAPIAAAFGGNIVDSLFDNTDEQIERNMQQRRQFLEGEKPELLQAESFAPEMMDATLVQEDPRLAGLQNSYLDRLFGLSESGLSDADAASFAQAEADASRGAKQSSDAIIRQMQSRGIGGSGQELALRQMATDEARNRAMDRNLAQAGDTARQRAVYAKAYGDALGGMRDQGYRAQRDNTDILNRFTQANTNARNDARRGNIERRMNTAQTNVANRQAWANTMAGQYDQEGRAAAAENARRADQRNQRMDLGFRVGSTLMDQQNRDEDRQLMRRFLGD